MRWRDDHDVRLIVALRYNYMGMDKYLLIPFLMGWTSISFTSYFDVHQGYKVLTHPHIYIHIYNIIIWQSLSRWLVWSENHVLLIDSPVSTCFHCSNLRHFASNASVQIHRYSALHVSGARKKEAGSLRRRGPWWDFVAARRCLFILNLFQVLPTYQERIVTSYIRVCGWKLLLWNPLMSLIFSYLLLSTYTKWAVFQNSAGLWL